MKLKKSLGQHILVSKGVLEKIASCIDIEKKTVIEIGGGTGNLTRELLEKNPEKLIVVEIDREMVEVLRSINRENIEIVNEDASTYEFCKHGKDLVVIGNLPYNMYSLIIENIVRHHYCIREACFLLQKEVSERIVGKINVGWLSLFVRTFYRVEYIMTVPSRFFKPPPKVNSGLIKLKRLDKCPVVDIDKYVWLLKKLFSNRRKMLKNKINEDILIKCKIDPKVRAEKLKPEDVLCIYNYMEEAKL